MPADELATTPGGDVAPNRPAPRLPRWSTWGVPVAVFLVTCVTFLPAVHNEFVSLDDHKNFQRNYHYRGLGADNVKWAWTTFHNGAYQPLSWMSFSTQYVAWGMDPTGYHVVSVVLHAVNGVLFFWVVVRVLALAMPAAARQHPVALRNASALAALLFALHPLRAEPVAWVSCQPYLPVGMFYLLSLLAYLRACRDDVSGPAHVGWVTVSCLCYAGSILSKGVGVGLVAVLVILDVYPLRRLWPGRARGQPRPPPWRVLVEKTPFLLLGIGSALLAVQSKLEAMVPVASYDIPHRVVQAAWGLLFYLTKTVLPVNLSPWYQFQDGFSVWEPRFVISVVLVVALTVAAIALWRRWLPGTVLWGYYLVVLLPLSHLVRLGRQAAADRYTYVSCMGWAVLVGAGVLGAWRARSTGRLGRSTFNAIAAVSAAACLILGVLTWRQVQVWRDGLSLWTRAVEVSPDIVIPRNNVAQELRARGDYRGAMAHLHAAVQRHPNDPLPRNALASVLLDMGMPDEAMEQVRIALHFDPDNRFSHGTLGAIYLAQGQFDKAIASLTRALELRATDGSARCNLASALIRTKRYDEAIEHCRDLLDRFPDIADAHNLWGMALIGKGETDAGIQRMQQGLALDANATTARLNLSRVLVDRKRYREALDLLRAGAELPRPDPRVVRELVNLLLTCPDPALRDPVRALTRAQRASRQAKGRNVDYLELTATALAATDAWDQAIAVGQQALDLARKQNRLDLVQRLAGCIEDYRRQRDGMR